MTDDAPAAFRLAKDHLTRGDAFADQEDWDSAATEFGLAAHLFGELGEISDQAEVIRELAHARREQGALGESVELLNRARAAHYPDRGPCEFSPSRRKISETLGWGQAPQSFRGEEGG